MVYNLNNDKVRIIEQKEDRVASRLNSGSGRIVFLLRCQII